MKEPGRASSVYRLPGVGVDGGAIIAKRTYAQVAHLERTIYEYVLPHLSLSTPRYYGSWFEGENGWLLLEDVAGEPYRRRDPEHQRLTAQWVGTLHASAAGLEAARALPDAGPARYLDHLRVGRAEIGRAIELLRFPEDEIRVLETVVSQLDAVEADWSLVEALCRDAPDTLVHGDVQAKNLFLSRDGDGHLLRVIDWEMAGFGCPAADLTRLDLDHYWPVVRTAWPDMTLGGVRCLATAGHIFQAVAYVYWLTAWFKCEREEDRRMVVPKLMTLVDRLRDASRSARQQA